MHKKKDLQRAVKTFKRKLADKISIFFFAVTDVTLFLTEAIMLKEKLQ